jgi:hypothetical protein
VSAPTINPAALTADTTANRLAELVTHYIGHNQPGHFDRDTWDEMAALATAWRTHTGWNDDRNETEAVITNGDHDGVDPTRNTDADWAPILAACPVGTAPADEGAWVGWPNSVRRSGAAA